MFFSVLIEDVIKLNVHNCFDHTNNLTFSSLSPTLIELTIVNEDVDCSWKIDQVDFHYDLWIIRPRVYESGYDCHVTLSNETTSYDLTYFINRELLKYDNDQDILPVRSHQLLTLKCRKVRSWFVKSDTTWLVTSLVFWPQEKDSNSCNSCFKAYG